jgi:hypothetical protein
VEQFLLVALIGIVEQSTADPIHEASAEQRPSGAPRPGQDRRLHRPHAEAAKMVEGFPIGIGDDEARVSLALRPVERKRDLVGPLLHSVAFGG